MTVQELIDELLHCPQDALVYLYNGDGEVTIDEVEQDRFYGYTRKVVIK